MIRTMPCDDMYYAMGGSLRPFSADLRNYENRNLYIHTYYIPNYIFLILPRTSTFPFIISSYDGKGTIFSQMNKVVLVFLFNINPIILVALSKKN